ncbi:MAG: hypothetical protein HY921_10265 [Elusimicrobia bacterium]|nr:hypothetical protein [Elusimicrobiota bacterium]
MSFRVVWAWALLLWPQALLAWSPNGHRAVALLAQERLAPAVSRAVRDLLGPDRTLAQIAPCPDYIRDNRGAKCAGLILEPAPQSRPWHFIDIPVADSPKSAADLAKYCARGGCAPYQIREEMEILGDPRAARSEKQIALMYLVHFVADMHQPLHCATEIVDGADDHGGNLKPVTWESAGPYGERSGTMETTSLLRGDEDESAGGLNLHSLWDRIIQPADSSDPAALSRILEDRLQGRDTSPWISGDFVSAAALESFAISKAAIYPAYHAPGGSRIGLEYRQRMEAVALERLAMAGVRLAALLEIAFQGAPQP